MFYEIGWTSWFISPATFKFDWNFISETFSDCEWKLYLSFFLNVRGSSFILWMFLTCYSNFLYNFGNLPSIGIETLSHLIIEPLISHTLTLQCCLIVTSWFWCQKFAMNCLLSINSELWLFLLTVIPFKASVGVTAFQVHPCQTFPPGQRGSGRNLTCS